MSNFWKSLWNRFVDGFETGLWNILLFVVGALDVLDALPLYLFTDKFEKLGTVLIVLAVVGVVVRFVVTLPWVKKFEEKGGTE